MTIDEFTASLGEAAPPAELSPPLRALWEDAKGHWDAAHAIAQDVEDASGAWVHAYLHRKEGDLGNASHWYRRAGRPPAADALDAEWRRIVAALL